MAAKQTRTIPKKAGKKAATPTPKKRATSAAKAKAAPRAGARATTPGRSEARRRTKARSAATTSGRTAKTEKTKAKAASAAWAAKPAKRATIGKPARAAKPARATASRSVTSRASSRATSAKAAKRKATPAKAEPRKKKLVAAARATARSASAARPMKAERLERARKAGPKSARASKLERPAKSERRGKLERARTEPARPERARAVQAAANGAVRSAGRSGKAALAKLGRETAAPNGMLRPDGAREAARDDRKRAQVPANGSGVRPSRGPALSARPVASGEARHESSGRRAGSGGLTAVVRAEPTRISVPREPVRVMSIPLPTIAPPRKPTVDERSAALEARLAAQSEEFRQRYIDSFDMSWIYHDSALDGVVYSFEELRAALGGQAPPMADSSLQPTYDDIRRHKEAIDFVRDFATKKRLPITVDVIKKLYLILHPEEGDIKLVKYRKDVPQHRLYFHEYAPPDKIAYKVRQIVDWLNDPETRKTRNGIRIAARAHYDLLRVYPFPVDSGRVARLFMNLLLLRSGLPPSIIHSTERQRYYEALKGSATTVLQMVQEAVENALASVEKLLDEHETKKRAFVS